MNKIKRLNTNKEKHKRIKLLTLFRKDGHCRYCSRIRGVAQKRLPCLKSVTDIINKGLAEIMSWKFYTGVAKEAKLKVRKFLVQIATFVEGTREN